MNFLQTNYGESTWGDIKSSLIDGMHNGCYAFFAGHLLRLLSINRPISPLFVMQLPLIFTVISKILQPCTQKIDSTINHYVPCTKKLNRPISDHLLRGATIPIAFMITRLFIQPLTYSDACLGLLSAAIVRIMLIWVANKIFPENAPNNSQQSPQGDSPRKDPPSTTPSIQGGGRKLGNK